MRLSDRVLRLPLIAALCLGFVTTAAAGQRAPRPAKSSGSAAPVAPTPAHEAPKSLAEIGLAKSAVGSSEPGWLYAQSDIPPDPKWYFGTLSNGVRYAVRKNGVPPGQVSVRVRIDAGALYETESERGFAHFIEHLTFRGSAYVPDGEAKRVWQRMGTTFGSDTNAQTTMTQTVYKLDLPGATESGLDESLKILSGMMEKPNITPATITAERPVVLAEQRELPGPQVRVGDAVRATLFAGQPLSDRSPIGNVKTLEAATAASVKAFHDRWYRPERAVVIVSGDVDPALAERLIAKNFSQWIRSDAPPAEPDFGKPDPDKPLTGSAVEPTLPQVITYAVLRPWEFHPDTILFNQNRLVDLVAIRVINRRLESRARTGGSFLQAGVDLQDVSRSANGTFVNIVPATDDWAGALKDVRAVIADAEAAAPTQAEIDRELSEFDAAMKNSVDTDAAEAGAKEADDLVEALDIRETVTSAKAAYDILKDAEQKGMFNPDAMLASTKRLFTGTATHAFITLRAADATAGEKLALALKADVSGLAGKRTAIANVSFDRLPPLGPPATVVSQAKLGSFGSQQVEFSNGVRMIVFPSKSEASRVYVRVRFGGGLGSLPANRPSLIWTGDLALVASGIGGLGQEELDALTAGRRIGLDFGADNDAFTFSATTNPADLPDQLLLIAQKLANPSWDPNPVTRARAVALTAYDGYTSSPGGILARDLDGLMHGGDPRWKSPTAAEIKALTPKAFRAFWAPILAAGPIEVDVFGDIDTQAAIDAVAKTFGAMKPRKAGKPGIASRPFPAHVAQPVVLRHSGPDNQAVAVIAWPTGGGIDGMAESRRLDVLAAVFSDRLFERLRNDSGASYSPSVDSQWPIGMDSGGRLTAVGQVPPDKVDFFYKLCREIAQDLATKPVEADELKRTLLPMLQYILRASTGNTFWLSQLQGATYDPRRVAALEKLSTDFTSISADDLRATAQRYLKPDTDWTLVVLPTAASAQKEASPAR